MSLNRAVRAYVAAMAIAAGVVLAIASRLPAVSVDAWTLFSLFFVGCILEVSRTHNKSGGMSGSLVFVFHLAGGLVVGGFWGGNGRWWSERSAALMTGPRRQGGIQCC